MEGILSIIVYIGWVTPFGLYMWANDEWVKGKGERALTWAPPVMFLLGAVAYGLVILVFIRMGGEAPCPTDQYGAPSC